MAFPNDSTVFYVSFIKFNVSFYREFGREAKWRSEVASWTTDWACTIFCEISL